MSTILPDEMIVDILPGCFGQASSTDPSCSGCVLRANCLVERVTVLLASEAKKRGVFTMILVPIGTPCASCGERAVPGEKVHWRSGELLCKACWSANPRG